MSKQKKLSYVERAMIRKKVEKQQQEMMAQAEQSRERLTPSMSAFVVSQAIYASRVEAAKEREQDLKTIRGYSK